MLGPSILVSIASLIVSVFGFVNQAVLALYFGASASMDAYLVAISIPMFVAGILSVGLSYSLVPELMLHKEDHEGYRSFTGLLFLSFFVCGIFISVLGFFASPLQIKLLGSTLTTSAKQDAVAVARISWVTAGVMLLVAHLRGIHNADQRFLFATMTSLVPFICMIFAAVLFSPAYGILSVAWGMLVGFVLVIPLLLVHSIDNIDVTTKCLLPWRDVARYFSRAPSVIAAMLCFTAFQSIDAYWAPLVGAGSLAYLGYCQRMLVAIGNLVIAGPAAVVLPRLSIAYAEGRMTDLLNDTQRAIRMVITFAVPVALYVSVLAGPVVRLFFERGAFDRDARQGVAALLPIMMLGMIAMLCVVMIFKTLFAKRDVMQAAMLGATATVMYFVFSGVMSQWFGVYGIALAYALTWWVVLIFAILTVWRGQLDLIFHFESRIFLGKVIALAVATGAVCSVGDRWIALHDWDNFLAVQLTIIALFSAVIYCTLAIRFFKLQELRIVYNAISKKVGT
jgi:putative peptidoglycan lipid II flippase